MQSTTCWLLTLAREEVLGGELLEGQRPIPRKGGKGKGRGSWHWVMESKSVSGDTGAWTKSSGLPRPELDNWEDNTI